MARTKKINEYKEGLITDLPFFVLNKDAQYFSGFRRGRPYWSNNFDEARILEREEQFNFLALHETFHKPEKFYQ